MKFEELIEKSLMELRDMAKDRQIPNIKKLRKNELAAILAGDKAAPVPGKRGRKPKVREQQEEAIAQENASPATMAPAPVVPVTEAVPTVEVAVAEAPKPVVTEEVKKPRRGRPPKARPENQEQTPAAPKKRGRPPKAKAAEDAEKAAQLQEELAVAPAPVEAPVLEEKSTVEAVVAPAVEESVSHTPTFADEVLSGQKRGQAEEEAQSTYQNPSVEGNTEKRESGYVPRFVNRDANRFSNNKPRYNNSYSPRSQQRQGGYNNGYSNNRRYENNESSYNNRYNDSRRYASASNGSQEERPARPPRQYSPVQEQVQSQIPEQEAPQPYYNEEYGTSNPAVPRMLENEDCPHVAGMLEIMPEGYGFLRVSNYCASPKDLYLSNTQIRRFAMRCGDYVEGRARPHREGDKFDALMYIDRINGMMPDENLNRICFEDLVPVYPDERYTLEVPGQKNELSVRLIDLIAPIGKGQRAMIVSQPKAGKTTLLKQIAAGISTNYPEAHLMVLLIDERPEEVTDMQRCIQGEVIYSTFDELPEHHTRIAEMVQERAMRLVEQGEDVVILLDSLTRLARAYNLVIPPTGRTLSGGMDPGALHKPKRFFGAARNIEGGGSLTVIATALVETGSRMDDIVYEEFKGTGNMEIHLDRKLSEKRVFPAIDIYKSGTRRDDLLLSKKELEGVYMLRKFMAGGATTDVTEQVIPMLQKTSNNDEFIAKIKDWIKIYENKGYSITGSQNRYGQ